MVPREGFEPSSPCGQRCLRPSRIPFRHRGIGRHRNKSCDLFQGRLLIPQCLDRIEVSGTLGGVKSEDDANDG